MKLLYLSLVLLFLGCSSDNAMTKVYQQNLPKDGFSCLKLQVFPPNEKVEESFKKLYSFNENCEFTLQVEVKGGITCNSNHNLQKKALGAFPSSYINMQLNQKSQKIYSYYIDLKEDVNDKDIQNAFERMSEELNL
jgi:hypothetical protein